MYYYCSEAFIIHVLECNKLVQLCFYCKTLKQMGGSKGDRKFKYLAMLIMNCFCKTVLANNRVNPDFQ